MVEKTYGTTIGVVNRHGPILNLIFLVYVKRYHKNH